MTDIDLMDDASFDKMIKAWLLGIGTSESVEMVKVSTHFYQMLHRSLMGKHISQNVAKLRGRRWKATRSR